MSIVLVLASEVQKQRSSIEHCDDMLKERENTICPNTQRRTRLCYFATQDSHLLISKSFRFFFTLRLTAAISALASAVFSQS